jgi:L-lactate permease
LEEKLNKDLKAIILLRIKKDDQAFSSILKLLSTLNSDRRSLRRKNGFTKNVLKAIILLRIKKDDQALSSILKLLSTLNSDRRPSF